MGVLSEEEIRTVKDIGIIGSMLIQNVVGAYCPIVDDLEEVFYW